MSKHEKRIITLINPQSSETETLTWRDHQMIGHNYTNQKLNSEYILA